MRTALVAALLAFTLLAGCSNGGGSDSEVDFSDLELEATPDTGIIRGIVFDPSIQPVGDATVTATGPDQQAHTATTTATGAFGFDGLAPGTYFVGAAKPGYISAAQNVEVMANVADPDVVKIRLEVDPATKPYIDTLQWDGFIECSFSLVAFRLAACDGVGNDEFLQSYAFDQPPSWIQTEMVWDSTQSGGDEMQISVTDFSTDLQVRVNASAGPSPVYLTVNETQIQEFRYGVNNTYVLRVFNDAVDSTNIWPNQQIQDAYAASGFYGIYNGTPVQGVVGTAADTLDIPLGVIGTGAQDPFAECLKYPVLFDACFGLGGVGATIEQGFTVYTHVFYHTLPNPGWRFSADGPHPPPV
ncbi:MAG TPA: carboxypeptidase-like regulatory domain-containing protein [Candidatus Thermoplasmatota archaeon]|nr:carboxypeptidase-like regulatory domain-containing protein [Candidatus Thermoplasmatota archaeon]